MEDVRAMAPEPERSPTALSLSMYEVSDTPGYLYDVFVVIVFIVFMWCLFLYVQTGD